MVPRKVYSPDDFRPGTKKGKIDAHPVWVVTIIMPKKLMQDMFQGHEDKENRALADSMRYEEMLQQNQQGAQESAEETEIAGAGDEATI